MGFISNPKEGAILDSEEGQNEIAESIANAITKYKKENFGSGNDDIIIKPSQKIETIKVTDTPKTVKPAPVTPIVKKTETKPEVKTEISSGIVFKVQLSASSKKLELVPSNFNGLSSISISEEGTLYKYMYGNTSSIDAAKQLLQEAKGKGYSSAFIIAFKDGKKVSLQEALKQ
jgi:N-acetylmuramoyl-L-alanine amidase